MSEVSVVSDRFWREFKPDVAQTLSDEQRGEIERVLDGAPASNDNGLGDLRLSFKWFFVRIGWGPERRSRERLKKEQELHPLMTRRNAPMLASLFASYMALWYIIVALGVLALFYFLR